MADPIVQQLALHQTLPIHPAATIYPLGEVNALLESIQLSGQQTPGIIFEQMLLDGRRRLHVTRKLNLPFLYHEITSLEGRTPLDFVMAANQSRQLSASQRALVAARARPDFLVTRSQDLLAKGEVSPHFPKGKTRDLLGKLFAVDGKLVDAATLVVEQGQPELIEAVEQDKLGVAAAKKILRLSPETQREVAAAALAGDKGGMREILQRSGAKSPRAFQEQSASRKRLKTAAAQAVEILAQLRQLVPDYAQSEHETMMSHVRRVVTNVFETPPLPDSSLPLRPR
jgi:hypothetical protein